MTLQLEMNLEDRNTEEMRIYHLQKQLDSISESLGKVRRKMFCEITEVKRICSKVMQENEELRSLINRLNDAKKEWVYTQDDFLFQEAG